MSESDANPTIPRKAGEETYAYRHEKSTAGVAQRRAETYAAFLAAYLHPGMRLLDCGCGPGSITCGLAAIVAPGEVVGIDFDPKAIAFAMDYLARQGATNVCFRTANVYELPFPDASFDAVFAHGLVEHLIEPDKAIREMRRVLRPGGVIGVRAPDFDGNVVAPMGSAGAEAMRLLKELLLRHSETPCVGKDLRGLLHQAGCAKVIATASYECHGTPESLREVADSLCEGIDLLFVPAGLLSPEQAARLSPAVRAWGGDSAAFLARNWCEAVGWVE